MAKYYTHDGTYIRHVGQCQDGMESAHCPAGQTVVLGDPPWPGPPAKPGALWNMQTNKWEEWKFPQSVQYAVDRRSEYPSVEDQMDMFWHAMNDGVIPKIQPFFDKIKGVKDKYPKPVVNG